MGRGGVVRTMPGSVEYTCPQLIDPSIDCLAVLLLNRMHRGTHYHVSINAVRYALNTAPCKPLVVFLTTDPLPPAKHAKMHTVRRQAIMHGVPVVHTLSRSWMGRAAGLSHSTGAVVIMNTPTHVEKELLNLIYTKALAACTSFIDLIEPPSPEPSYVSSSCSSASLLSFESSSFPSSPAPLSPSSSSLVMTMLGA